MTARKINGAWFVDFWWTHQHGTTIGERERIRVRSPINTKRGAEAHEQLLRARLHQGKLLSGVDPKAHAIPTFSEFWENDFFKSYCKANNKPSVQRERECIYNKHLKDALGPMRLDHIGPREIERFKAERLEKGVKQKRLRNILIPVSKALRWAEEIGVIEHAPKMKLPRVSLPKVDFLTDDEYARLLAPVMNDTQRFAMIVVGRDAGLRKGEILGLNWDDLDFVARTIVVRRSVWQERRSEAHVGTPKSGRDRKIPMTDRLHRALKAHRHLRGERVFCDDSGCGLTPAAAEAALKYACRRAGLRQIGWHVLRHTFGSRLAQEGASPKVIQELMGHSDLTTTLRYMHLAPSHHVEAINLLDRPTADHAVRTA